MSVTEQRTNASAVARWDAVKNLIAAHQDEFDQLLGQARVNHGLSAKPMQGRPVNREKLEQKIEKAEARLAKMRNRLASAPEDG